MVMCVAWKEENKVHSPQANNPKYIFFADIEVIDAEILGETTEKVYFHIFGGRDKTLVAIFCQKLIIKSWVGFFLYF